MEQQQQQQQEKQEQVQEHEHQEQEQEQERVETVIDDKTHEERVYAVEVETHSPHHTIDIAADTSDSDMDDEPTVADSVCVCHIHYDDAEERVLQIDASMCMPHDASHDGCDDVYEHEYDASHDVPEESHVCDDAYDSSHDDMTSSDAIYNVKSPADWASRVTSMWPDLDHKPEPRYEDDTCEAHETHDDVKHDTTYAAEEEEDAPLPNITIDAHGFMHFTRDARFCLGPRECWEAKHIHEGPFEWYVHVCLWCLRVCVSQQLHATHVMLDSRVCSCFCACCCQATSSQRVVERLRHG